MASLLARDIRQKGHLTPPKTASRKQILLRTPSRPLQPLDAYSCSVPETKAMATGI